MERDQNSYAAKRQTWTELLDTHSISPYNIVQSCTATNRRTRLCSVIINENDLMWSLPFGDRGQDSVRGIAARRQSRSLICFIRTCYQYIFRDRHGYYLPIDISQKVIQGRVSYISKMLPGNNTACIPCLEGLLVKNIRFGHDQSVRRSMTLYIELKARMLTSRCPLQVISSLLRHCEPTNLLARIDEEFVQFVAIRTRADHSVAGPVLWWLWLSLNIAINV